MRERLFLVIATTADDADGQWAVSGLRKRGLRVELTTIPLMLRELVWRCEGHGARFEMAVPLEGGGVLHAGEVAGAINCVTQAPADTVLDVALDDREYAWSEIHAIVTAAVALIPRTINPAVSPHLNGRYLGRFEWASLVRRAGLRMEDGVRANAPPAIRAWALERTVVVAGPLPEEVRDGIGRLRALAALPLLHVELQRHRKEVLVSDVSANGPLAAGGDPLLDALAEHLAA